MKEQVIGGIVIAIAVVAAVLYLGYLCYSQIAPAFGLPTLSFLQTTAGLVLVSIVGNAFNSKVSTN